MPFGGSMVGFADGGDADLEFVVLEHPAPGGGIMREGIWRSPVPPEPEAPASAPETADNGE
jgi:hypothetical protein